MWEYTDTVREHFLNPRNVGALENANAIGEVGSLACGDALKLYLHIDDNDVITAATFQTFGCASAIASSSVLTELIKGLTVEDALKVTNKEIAEHLGGLPKEKMHCSVMGQEALEAAIRNWRGLAPLEHDEEGKLICKCFGITDNQIIHAIRENGLRTVEEVTNFTKAGGACGDCMELIGDIVKLELSAIGNDGKPLQELAPFAPAKPCTVSPKPRLTNMQRMKAVTQTMDEVIRPSLQKDGGDIELVDIDGTTVYVTLQGACQGCPSSQKTLVDFVQATLRKDVDDAIIVQKA